MNFMFALRQVCLGVLALALGILAMTLPFLFGIKQSGVAPLQLFLFFISQALAIGFTSEKPLGRGDQVFAWALICFGLMLASVGLAYAIRFFTEIYVQDALVAVSWGWGILFVVSLLIHWLTDIEDDSNTEVVKRGRVQVDRPLYLYVPTEMSEHGQFAEVSSDESDDDPEAYARYRASRLQIPEQEFDPTYVYDVRRPYRLPLRRDSKYRQLFEGGSDE